jgi:DNA polymerase-3 subunit delta
VWGAKERLFERAVPLLTDNAIAQLVEAAQVCDGLAKGLKHPDWPFDAWEGLKRLVLMLVQWTASGSPRKTVRLALTA